MLVLRGRAGDYDGRSPHPQRDVALLVEVSDTSLSIDRTTKAQLDSSHGVSEYWIVNQRDRIVEVRRLPRPELRVYAETIILRDGEVAQIGGGSVETARMLPKAD